MESIIKIVGSNLVKPLLDKVQFTVNTVRQDEFHELKMYFYL